MQCGAQHWRYCSVEKIAIQRVEKFVVRGYSAVGQLMNSGRTNESQPIGKILTDPLYRLMVHVHRRGNRPGRERMTHHTRGSQCFLLELAQLRELPLEQLLQGFRHPQLDLA